MIPSEFQKYIRSKEFKDLLADYRQASLHDECKYFDDDDLLDIAEYYHVKGNPEEADKVTDYMLRLYPDNVKALVFKARQAVMNGDVELAEHYSNMIKSEELTDVAYLRAELMVCKGKAEEADAYLTNSYKALPKSDNEDDDTSDSDFSIYDNDQEDEDEPVSRDDFALDIALLFCDHRYWELSEKWLDRVKDSELRKSGDYLEVRAILLTVKGEYEKAERLWNEYIDLDAYSVRAWLQLSQCQFNLGHPQESLQSAEYAEAIDPNMPEVYLAKGNSQFSLGDNTGALQNFNKFLSLCPNDVQGEVLTASVLFSMEKYKEGYEHILTAIKSMENDDFFEFPENIRIEVYRQAAFLCSAMGKIDEALQYADKLLLCGVAQEKCKLLKAGIYLESQMTKEAFEVLTELLQSTDHEPEMYVTVGCMLVDAGLMETGYQMLSSTLRILEQSEVKNKFGYDRLAYAALVIGKYDDFLIALEKAIEKNPSETVTIFSSLFPKDMPLSDYLDYAKTHKIEDTRYKK